MTTPPAPAPTLQPDTSAAAFRLVGRRRTRSRSRSRRRTHVSACDDGAEAEVENKIAALQKIIPGGESLPVSELFEETAEYIFALETQVKALRFLAAFVQSSEKRMRKLGA